MAHTAIWGYLPNQKQNKNSGKLTVETLSESGLRRGTKFGQAHLNYERKIKTFVDFAFKDVRVYKYYRH